MEVILDNISKRYIHEWIFKKIKIHFKAPMRYALLGANGSGKSTLLKIISGHLSPTKGSIHYQINHQKIAAEDIYKQVSFAAPYISLIEEFTLREAIQFHQKFKPFRSNINSQQLLQLIQLEKAADKEIRFFSSGMKQRLKLGLAICSDTPLLLLDEPTSNLDEKSIAWYQQLLNDFSADRLVLVASNEKRDIVDCQEQLNVLDFK